MMNAIQNDHLCKGCDAPIDADVEWCAVCDDRPEDEDVCVACGLMWKVSITRTPPVKVWTGARVEYVCAECRAAEQLLNLHSCDGGCGKSYHEDDMYTLGGDRDTINGPVAYPAVCNDCARAEAAQWGLVL